MQNASNGTRRIPSTEKAEIRIALEDNLQQAAMRDGVQSLVLRAGDFFGAQEGFEAFVADYPDHERADEAQFWLGETYFINSDFAEAADAYIASLRADGRGPKAPDALVRLASSLSNLGRDNDACQTLGRFSSQFPNANADARARANREAMRIGCR